MSEHLLLCWPAQLSLVFPTCQKSACNFLIRSPYFTSFVVEKLSLHENWIINCLGDPTHTTQVKFHEWEDLRACQQRTRWEGEGGRQGELEGGDHLLEGGDHLPSSPPSSLPPPPPWCRSRWSANHWQISGIFLEGHHITTLGSLVYHLPSFVGSGGKCFKIPGMSFSLIKGHCSSSSITKEVFLMYDIGCKSISKHEAIILFCNEVLPVSHYWSASSN